MSEHTLKSRVRRRSLTEPTYHCPCLVTISITFRDFCPELDTRIYLNRRAFISHHEYKVVPFFLAKLPSARKLDLNLLLFNLSTEMLHLVEKTVVSPCVFWKKKLSAGKRVRREKKIKEIITFQPAVPG